MSVIALRNPNTCTRKKNNSTGGRIVLFTEK